MNISLAKHLLLFIVTAATALAVTVILLYSNLGWEKIYSYFQGPNPYQDTIILFYSDTCSHCKRVDTFLEANKASDVLPFLRLDIAASEFNVDVLADKAQICGLDYKKIGIPFLWNPFPEAAGPASKKCIIGYVDVIDFFKVKLNSAK